ncbi:MAG: hypothetical protein RIQ54_386 [Candidatus Parcubacteria bacterium]|jgi:hypothetical protein
MDHEIEPLPKTGALWGTKTGSNTGIEQAIFDELKNKKGINMAWVLAGITLAVTVCILAGLYYVLFYGRIQGPSVDIATTALDEVFIGAPFPLNVSLSNFSPESIGKGTVTLYLPASFYFAGATKEVREREMPVGPLQSQQTVRESFSIVSDAAPQSVSRLRIVFRYEGTGEAIGKIFEKEYFTDILTSRSAVSIHIDTAKFAYNGKPFDIAVTYKNNTKQTLAGGKISVQYPIEFQPTNAASSMGERTFAWDVPEMKQQEEGRVILNGALIGPANAFFNFSATSHVYTATNKQDLYETDAQTASISIYPEPFSVIIKPENSNGFIQPSEQSSYTVTVFNNSEITFKNATIRVQLSGDMLDITRVEPTNGVFDSRINTISWSVAGTPQLTAIEPGKNVSVSFSIGTKKSFPTKTTGNSIVSFDAQASSPTVPSNTAATQTIATAKLDMKIGGIATPTVAVYHVDPKNKTLNSGPYPPAVNQPTRYSVYWKVSATGAPLQKTTLSTFLQGNTAFISILSVSPETRIVYDKNSGKTVWDIGAIPAGETREASFQIESVPAITDLNSQVPLIGASVFEAVDAFTGNKIKISLSPVESNIPDDRKASSKRQVVP